MPVSFDETSIMPSETVAAAVRTAIDAHNAEMPAAERDRLIRGLTQFLPFVLGVLFLAWLFIIGMKSEESEFRSFMLVALAAGGWYVGAMLWRHVNAPVTGLKQFTRDRIIPQIFGFVDDVVYTNGREPRFSGRIPHKSVVQFTRIEHDDIIRGRYEGVAFELCECVYWEKSGKSERQTFRGVILQFALPVAFAGELAVARRKTGWQRFLWGLPRDGHLKEVLTGDRWADDNYQIATTNRDAAKPIVEQNPPKLLKWLEATWHDGPPIIILKDKDGYLFLPSDKNLFELPVSDVKLDYQAHIEPMIREFVTLIATATLVRKAFSPAEQPPESPDPQL